MWDPIEIKFALSVARGVCVYISNTLECQIVDFKATSDGRKILINLLTNGEEFTLFNVYAPTNKSNREQFFKRLKTFIRRNCKNMSKLIIGGNMNCVLNPSKDTKGARSMYKPSNALAIILSKFPGFIFKPNRLVKMTKLFSDLK